MSRRRISKLLTRLPLLAAAAGVAFLAQRGGDAEAGPPPDPQEVQRFLAELEAKQRAEAGEAERRKGYEKRVRNLVEGATVRAPSEAAINRLEDSLVDSLSG